MEQDTRAVAPERFIASRLPYAEVERRVREMGDIKPDISISDDGYWVINGEKTNFKAEVGEAPVQSVNGKTGDVHLTASDVGARPNTWLPTVEQIGARPDTWMPTAEQVGARPSTWTPTYSDVGADKSGTAASSVSAHNTNTESHNDIRVELKALADRIAAVLDSDDTTLDELSEIVAYIKSNKSLIDSITTSKVNVTDIINNLTTNVTNKPLSAAQGVTLKALIDALSTNKLDASALTSAINTALAQAKASGEFDGKDGANGSNGKDGVSVTHSWNGTVLTITSASGTSSADLKGDKGEDGADGKTPIVGVDYFTEADKSAIVIAVMEAIGTPLFGLVDDNNNVILSGKLGDGSYNIKYEMADGSTVNIGSLLLDNAVYYTISNNLTNCTNGNAATKVVEGKPYTATISANSGYTLTSVKVTMGGVDITSSAVSGGNISIANVTGNIIITATATVATVYYSISNNLTNCTNSNSITSIAKGSSYSANISANSGYELKSVTVTMGGSHVSVTNGVINIASVTGNIVITAMAEETVVSGPTNFADPESGDWKVDCRLTTNIDMTTPLTGGVATNYISVQNGDIVTCEGINFENDNNRIAHSDGADGEAIGGIARASVYATTYVNNGFFKDVTYGANSITLTITCPTTTMRFSGIATGTSNDVVVNIKRNGEWL